MLNPNSKNAVALVIPGRNVSNTLRRCLDSVMPLLKDGQLSEIIYVDDHSTDDSVAIAKEYDVRVVCCTSGGPGAARNAGWQATRASLIWFIDADCVADEHSLSKLKMHLSNAPKVGAVGGSYSNLFPDSLVASLIHEEIIQRHATMPTDVSFLATYNVLYRREVLEELGGFQEDLVNGDGSAGAEDAEFAFRVRNNGWRLKFESDSLVGHHHQTELRTYLRVQKRHGYWRVPLYLRHVKRVFGDSYSGIFDHLQPVLATALTLLLPLLLLTNAAVAIVLVGILAALQVPMAVRLCLRNRSIRYLAFVPFGTGRAFARGLGMSFAIAAITRWAVKFFVHKIAAFLLNVVRARDVSKACPSFAADFARSFAAMSNLTERSSN